MHDHYFGLRILICGRRTFRPKGVGRSHNFSLLFAGHYHGNCAGMRHQPANRRREQKVEVGPDCAWSHVNDDIHPPCACECKRPCCYEEARTNICTCRTFGRTDRRHRIAGHRAYSFSEAKSLICTWTCPTAPAQSGVIHSIDRSESLTL